MLTRQFSFSEERLTKLEAGESANGIAEKLTSRIKVMEAEGPAEGVCPGQCTSQKRGERNSGQSSHAQEDST